MSFESYSSQPKPAEVMFQTGGRSGLIPFRLERRVILHPSIRCYVVIFEGFPKIKHIDTVLDLARSETVRFGGIDDLDTLPDLNRFPVDANLFRFTHALEHLTAIQLTRISLSALFQFRIQRVPAGMTTIYQDAVDNKFLVGFSLTPDFSPSIWHEEQSIQSACLQVSRLQPKPAERYSLK